MPPTNVITVFHRVAGNVYLASAYAELEHMGRDGQLGAAAAVWHRAEIEHLRAVAQLKVMLRLIP